MDCIYEISDVPDDVINIVVRFLCFDSEQDGREHPIVCLARVSKRFLKLCLPANLIQMFGLNLPEKRTRYLADVLKSIRFLASLEHSQLNLYGYLEKRFTHEQLEQRIFIESAYINDYIGRAKNGKWSSNYRIAGFIANEFGITKDQILVSGLLLCQSEDKLYLYSHEPDYLPFHRENDGDYGTINSISTDAFEYTKIFREGKGMVLELVPKEFPFIHRYDYSIPTWHLIVFLEKKCENVFLHPMEKEAFCLWKRNKNNKLVCY